MRQRPGRLREFRMFRERPRTARPRRFYCRGGDHLSDARAGNDFDVRLLFDPVATDALESRARQSELVVSEVPSRKGVETGQLQAEVAAKPHADGARIHEVDLDPGEHTVERGMSPREQRMGVAGLRGPRTGRRRVGQRVAVEHRHLLEVRRDRLRRRQPGHSGADDDGLFETWIAHFGYLYSQARLTPLWPRFQPRRRG